MKAIKPRILGIRTHREAKLKEIMQLIGERNIDDYRKEKEILKVDPSVKPLMEELEKRKEHIFFCEVEGSFIGIRRNNCQSINELLKRDFPEEVRVG